MVPTLFVSDRQFDLTLHLLSLVVGSALLVSLALLLVSSLSPSVPSDRGDVGPPAWAAMPEVFVVPPRFAASFAPLGPRVYRCEADGRVTYSDRPCERGRARVVPLPQS
jgi:hypothetical protein